MKIIEKYKTNFNDSSEFLNSLQSKSIGISPSLNYNSNSINSIELSRNKNITQQHKSKKFLKENHKLNKNLYDSKQRKLT